MTDHSLGTLVLRPSGKRSLLLLAYGLPLIINGAFRIGDGHHLSGGFALAGGLALAALAMSFVLPGGQSLRLAPEGLEIRSLFLRRRFRWSDVSDFRVGRFGAMLFDAPSSSGARKVRGVSAPGFTRFRAEELARHLNEWRSHAMQP